MMERGSRRERRDSDRVGSTEEGQVESGDDATSDMGSDDDATLRSSRILQRAHSHKKTEAELLAELRVSCYMCH